MVFYEFEGAMRWGGYNDKRQRKDTGFPIKDVGNDRRGVEDDRRGRERFYLVRYSMLFNFPVTNLWSVLEMRVW